MTRPDPLPEGHTAHTLAAALTAAEAPADLVDRAARGYYHDYLSPLDFPQLALVLELRRAAAGRDIFSASRLLDLANHVIDGDYDASDAEAEEWANSDEGQAARKELGL